MNFFGNQKQVECIVDACPLYKHTLLSPYLLITVFFPHYLTAGLFTLSVYRQELYVLLISIVLTSNYFLNHIIQRIFKDPPRFPDCYSDFGGPSFATQHLIMFDTILMTYSFFFSRTIRLKAVILLRFGVIFTLFCWVYIGANTLLELLSGAVVGAIYGLLFQFVVSSILIHPRLEWILSWRICRSLAIVDNLMIYNSELVV